jgi:hypothetical protein
MSSEITTEAVSLIVGVNQKSTNRRLETSLVHKYTPRYRQRVLFFLFDSHSQHDRQRQNGLSIEHDLVHHI